FDNLDVYDLKDGHKYTYAVNERPVDNYTMTKNGDDIINTIKEGKTTISGTKTWIDPKGTEHPEVTIVLLQNGKKFKEKVLKDGETEYSFDVPLHDGDGQLYKYTIEELNVEGYTSKVEGYNVINTIRQEQIMIAGSKSWNVPSGMEVPGVTINLLRDGEVVDSTVIESGSSQYQFSNLDKYDLSDGHEYEYTVMEAGCDGYSDSYDGLSIANTVNQKLISVSGTKIWVAPDDTEYPDITVILNKNGEPYRSVVLADGIVNYTFEGLEAYEYNNDGSVTENEYTISEEPVEGYTSDVNGYDLINISDEIMNGVNDGPDGDGTDKGILGKLLKTGDNMSVVLISIIALLALAGAAAAVFCRRRKLQ
ncbi:MAG: Cna B-type domain-containing protein, partial [Clostridiales bacterium]|nr:Cna B-type domain-containing protein [Clostridiales bacterium]